MLFLLLLAQTIVWGGVALARARFPFDDNIWSDQPSLLQLWRIAHHGYLYGPLNSVDSFDYGPMYLWILSGIQRLFHLPFDIVTFRFISMAIGILAVVGLIALTRLFLARFGLDPNARSAPTLGAYAATALVGCATLARNLTFDALHPDNVLLFLLVAILLVYFAIALGKIRAACAWALLLLCLAAVFTKLNAIALFPLLVAGLFLTGRTGKRLSGALVITYVAVTFELFVRMPDDMRAWTLSLPLEQPYEIGRYAQLFVTVVFERPYLAGVFLAAGLGVWLLSRYEGRRVYVLDGSALLGILVLGLSAYFKRFGVWNNITLIAFSAIPYAALLVAGVLRPMRLRSMRLPSRLAAAAAALAVVFGFSVPKRSAPNSVDVARMSAAAAAAHTLCETGQSIFVSVFPGMFLDCPNARFGLLVSWGELYAAHPEIVMNGPSRLDHDPGTAYFVWLKYPDIPWPQHPWTSHYRLVQRLPVAFGYGSESYALDASMEIYRRT